MSEQSLQTEPRPAVDAELEALLRSFRDVPTIPEVLARIWQLVDDPRSSASDLEKVVSMEPPLAAKVLRLANSPYYGGRGRVKDVQMAITSLGFDTLRNLAICLGVASSLSDTEARDPVLDRKALWQHSVSTAVLAQHLAIAVGSTSPDEVFTAGLLHDFGQFVISLGRPEAYAEILRRIDTGGLDLVEAERQVLGYDHAQVGAEFARQWHFPASLRDMIVDHHDRREEASRELRVMRVANALSHEWWGLAPLEGVEAPVVDEGDLRELGLDVHWLEEHREELVEEIDRAQEFMNLI